MVAITATEFAKNFGRYKEAAQREPIAITSYGRTSGYFVSARKDGQFRERCVARRRFGIGGRHGPRRRGRDHRASHDVMPLIRDSKFQAVRGQRRDDTRHGVGCRQEVGSVETRRHKFGAVENVDAGRNERAE